MKPETTAQDLLAALAALSIDDSAPCEARLSVAIQMLEIYAAIHQFYSQELKQAWETAQKQAWVIEQLRGQGPPVGRVQ